MAVPQTILLLSCVTLWVVFGLHTTALIFYLYWLFPWFDVLVHFLGGLGLGLWFYWFLYVSGYVAAHVMPRSRLAGVLLFSLLVALSWEVFEIVAHTFGNLSTEGNWRLDTIVDIFVGMFGALLGTGVSALLEKGGRKSQAA